MIGERLKRARAAAGLSMQALADQVGVSANMIKKYEHDESMPGSAVLVPLARALGVRSEYFFRPVEVELGRVEYRKRARTPVRVLRRIEADVLDQAERWAELANLWPEFPVPEFRLPENLPARIGALDEVDELADSLRGAWQLGMNPIPDLIDELEARGVLVIITDADEAESFDGLQASVAGKPVIVVSEHWPGDRQRFTLAHELGHLLLHDRLAPGIPEEKACHRFAAAFLLPAVGIRQHLGEARHHIEPRELHFLKMEYGLSMQACLYRAGDLEIINQNTLRKTWKLFSRMGWRTREPGDPCRREQTLLFGQLVYRALGEGIIGESKAAELLGVPLARFRRERQLGQQDAATGQ